MRARLHLRAVCAVALCLTVGVVRAQTLTDNATSVSTHTDNGTSTSTASSAGTVSGTATNAGNAQTTIFNTAPPPDKVTVRSAPGASAPGLTTTLSETCMGSSSAGVSGLAFGVSLGSTWNDIECVNRLNARELRSLGDAMAAKQVLCENKVVREAYRKTNAPCLE